MVSATDANGRDGRVTRWVSAPLWQRTRPLYKADPLAATENVQLRTKPAVDAEGVQLAERGYATLVKKNYDQAIAARLQ
jgi:hypothetical protein